MKKIGIAWLAAVAVLFSFNNNLKAQNMENRLNSGQQKIVTIAAYTAIGNLDALKNELNAGLDAGLTINRIKEVLVQMYAYAGFPRSLQGINTFMKVLEERKEKGINDPEGKDASPITDTRDKYTRGREILKTLTRTDQTKIAGANAFAPAIDTYLKEHLFADIFERDVLTYPERELATISALAAMQGVEPMLQSHMNMGMNVGITQPQLEEVADIISTSVGTTQGNIARDILEKVVEQRSLSGSGTKQVEK
ncbi:MAG: carboxymuconolactone decarboxylase family protein [Bacteroidales bacterium]|nr:carboxymuconolactone decarboxylase family protein [Bacteroidales bacterium]